MTLKPFLRGVVRAHPLLHRGYGTLRAARFRHAMARAERAHEARRNGGDGLPIPPPRLRYRVTGLLDDAVFLSGGREIALRVERLLALAGRAPDDIGAVLDFGCGCGRIARHLVPRLRRARYLGVDIDAEAIGWCREALPFGEWHITTPTPPLPVPDGGFDLLIALSVLAHLDEASQHAWLAEFHRVLAPGGVAIVSVNGEAAQRALSRAEHRILAERGFLYSVGQTGRRKLDGLPDFYQWAYHSREYIAREWSRLFTIAAQVPAGMTEEQDAVVLVKPPDRAR